MEEEVWSGVVVLAGWRRAPSAWRGRGLAMVGCFGRGGGGGGRELVGAIWQHQNILVLHRLPIKA